MHLLHKFLVLLIPFLVGHIDVSRAQEADPEDTSPYSSAELVSESTSVQPGTPFTLGLRLLMDPGWHSYWKNPGDSGEPTDIEWILPEGFTAGSIQWPYPERIDLPPLRTYGFYDEVLLLTEITPPANLEPGVELEITGTAYWLICEEICLPAEEALSLSIPIQASRPSPSPQAEAFTVARSKLPISLDNWVFEGTSQSGSYVLRVTSPAGELSSLEGAYFFAHDPTLLEHAAPQPMSRDGDSYLIALQESAYSTAPAERLKGVLVAAERHTFSTDGVRAIEIDAPVQDAFFAAQQAPNTSTSSLPWLLLLAFAGGLLLNLMPCVFPVLSIKILSFTENKTTNRKAVQIQGLTFGLGVLVSFWILAILLLVLRAAGSQIGWGFQLQSPLFVAGMATLFFVIGLNLMSVFEMGSILMRWGNKLTPSSRSSSFRRSFFDGVLATLVATPCTAPFMGAALGAAIVLPTYQALMIFTALGLGMALPYMVLSMNSNLSGRLPRPGAWMETLKQVLAFPMFLTTIWLIWVFGQQTGIDGVALMLTGLLLLGISLWIIGRWPDINLTLKIRAFTRITALLLFLAAVTIVYTGAIQDSSVVKNASGSSEVWQDFSPSEISQLRSEGRPVFIDFTAAWCLTCQVNKRTTLNSKTVLDAFQKKGVTLFQADWTNQDEEITQALEEHGRSGVPVYVLYTGIDEKPILLPEILTEEIVISALENLPDWTLASK